MDRDSNHPACFAHLARVFSVDSCGAWVARITTIRAARALRRNNAATVAKSGWGRLLLRIRQVTFAFCRTSKLGLSLEDSGMRFCFYPIVLTLSAAGMLTGTQPDRTTIGTTNLPGGTPAGNAYRAKLTAIGGTPSYSWSFLSGQLPTGLKLSDTGTLSGIPASAGQFSFNTGVEDTFRSMETAGSNLGNGTESDV